MRTLKDLHKALERKEKIVIMLAPSYAADFIYPEIIFRLREIGFDKIVELTFGAKMINRVYHEQLKTTKKLLISSVCAGIVETINNKHPEFRDKLAKIDSPMIATAKICKKIYPKHKTCFLSPCYFKIIEAKKSNYIDYCITYKELKDLLHLRREKKSKFKRFKHKNHLFDKFYTDYTRIYPLSGGLSKTAHIKGVLQPNQTKIVDGIIEIEKFLQKNKNKKQNSTIKFLDVTFCKGGCIGGPCLSSPLTIEQRKQKVLEYSEKARTEKVPKYKKGTIEKAKGIQFSWQY